jgi:DNA-binding NarL/FixJ family response regulator
MKRILLVEDDDLLRKAMTRQLAAYAGVEVTPKSDATKAFHALMLSSYDVVLTDYDLGLSSPSGLELLRAVERQYENIRRWLMSSSPKEDLDEIQWGSAISKFFPKPVDMKRVGRLLDLVQDS